MSQPNAEDYSDHNFRTLSEVYFQELIFEEKLAQWRRIDKAISILIALTASGSAIAGWSVWTKPGWKYIWLIMAAIASVASIAHSTLEVPSKIRELEELRSAFSRLRVDLETFQSQLDLDFDAAQASKQFVELRRRFGECKSRVGSNIIVSPRRGVRIRGKLDARLKEKGYIR